MWSSSRRALIVILAVLLVVSATGCLVVAKKPEPAPKRSSFEGLFRARGDFFEHLSSGVYTPFIVKGVNIGASTPGRWSTEFVKSEAFFTRWFAEIAAMNANSVRVYTLMAPAFYSALKKHNEANPTAQIWLIQEIWPDEEVPGGNLADSHYTKEFVREIALTIDSLSGRGDIPGRQGRAYGLFRADVSPYVMAVLVGRELEPDEVANTDAANSTRAYHGDYFEVTDGSPSECWLASMCDTTVREMRRNLWEAPVGFVSWPPIDPQEHDAEWDSRGKQFVPNDKASVDARHIVARATYPSGTFTAFHIYPNYPDFINNEPSYDEYHDSEGRLRYGGYLRELKANLPPVPSLVAEFGMATSIGIAHLAPDGLDHGGIEEAVQGKILARLFRAILAEHYAGGIIFEWNDEWAKKTWTTENLMIPYDRHVFWHNVMDPEQNYGLIAWQPEPSAKTSYVRAGVIGNTGRVPSIVRTDVWHDSEYLFVEVTLGAPSLAPYDVFLAIDTVDPERGVRSLPTTVATLDHASEVLLYTADGEAHLLFASSYNFASGRYMSSLSGDVWERALLLTNAKKVSRTGVIYPELRADMSRVRTGSLGGSHSLVNLNPSGFIARLPWATMGYSDPSSQLVIWDGRASPVAEKRDSLQVTRAPSVRLSIGTMVGSSSGGRVLTDSVQAIDYSFDGWEVPSVTQRLKAGYRDIAEEFAKHR